jgi:hypothetical protein
MKQYPDRTIWQRHVSECIPEYVESLDTKDSIPCPHLLCPAMLHSKSDLWHHLGDIHGTDKPHAAKKRQYSPDGGQDESSGAARRKRPRFLAKLEDRTSELPAGRTRPPSVTPKTPLAASLLTPQQRILIQVQRKLSRQGQCLAAPLHLTARMVTAFGMSMMTAPVLTLRYHLCQVTFPKQFLRLEGIFTLPGQLRRNPPPLILRLQPKVRTRS